MLNKNSPGRIQALDFAKGTLVLIMVLYHWLNYFVGASGDYYKYLRFLTPSFIFITGFLISHIYLAKYDPSDRRLSGRLLLRGLKLLTIFIVLNAAKGLVMPGSGGFSLENLSAIYLKGNALVAGGKVAAFIILVPIAYLLILSAVLVMAYKSYHYTFHAVAAGGVLAELALSLSGFESSNLELITIGLLGVTVGFCPIDRVDALASDHPRALLLAYAVYAAAITIWHEVFPLQIAGVLITLMLIYLLCTQTKEESRIRKVAVLLGKYSLLGYIGQIAILQVLHAGLQRAGAGASLLTGSFVAAFALTVFMVGLVDRVRAKSTIVNQVYRSVFA